MKERDSLHIKLAHQVGGAIACLLALALLLGLTACGRGQAQQPQTEPPATADKPPVIDEPKPDEPEPDAVPDQPEPADPADDEEHDGFPETEDDEEHPTGLPFTQEEFDQMVSDTLDALIKDDMSAMEQARAVFNYVHDNIRYTGHSDKSDWMTGAYDGLTTGKGDCFTYYAVSRALLTALEIDNLEVRRIEGTSSSHYWNLVNCGDGWYHFDACPRSAKMPSFLSFMVTDQQVADFTAMAGRHYYDFDDSSLPERATEIVTKTRPIARPAVTEEETEEGDGEEANIGEGNTENPEATVPDDEPVLPPDDLPGENGNTAEPPADWSEPGLGADPSDPPAASDGETPADVWTEPPAEAWPEPGLEDGGETEAG